MYNKGGGSGGDERGDEKCRSCRRRCIKYSFHKIRVLLALAGFIHSFTRREDKDDDADDDTDTRYGHAMCQQKDDVVAGAAAAEI